MLELKLITEEDLKHSARMYSSYQKNAFLLDHLLATDKAGIVEFCRLLQNTANQQEVGHMLVDGTNKTILIVFC